MVGSNMGQAHNQRQGYGKATVLQGDKAVDTYAQLKGEERLADGVAKAKKQADLDAAWKRMTDFNPDRWFKHESTIKENLNNFQDKGANLMLAGINPWTSNDKASVDFRKDAIRIAGLAEGSKQMKDSYTALRTKIDGADPGKYTSASLSDIADYFDKDVNEIIDGRQSPPALMQVKPMVQLQDYFSKVMAPLNQTRNGTPMSTEEKWKVARESINDPEKGDDLMDSFRSMFSQMSEPERTDIRKRAQAAGVSEIQQLSYDYVDRYSVERKPFEYSAWKKTALDRIEVPYKEWQGTESFSKKADKGELARIAGTVANDMFVADDRALTEYEAVLPRKSRDETDGAYKKRAIEHLTQNLIAETATNELAGQRESGKEKQDLTASRVKWLDYAMSPDPEKYREAAGYLFNTGSVLGNLTVSDSEIIPAQQQNNMAPYPVLRVKLQGNLTLNDVKEQLPDEIGGSVTNVVQRGTETDIEIPVTNQTENYLLSLHDRSFDDKKKTPFAGSFRENKVRTLSQLSGLGTNAAKQSAPKNNTFDFK